MNDLLTMTLLLMFVGAAICASVALSGSPRSTLFAISGNGAILTLLFLSMQPARVARKEIVFVAAVVPITSLFVVEGASN